MTNTATTPSSIWDSWLSEAKSGEAKIVKYWQGGLIIAALDSKLSPELWVEINQEDGKADQKPRPSTRPSKGLKLDVETVTVDSRICRIVSIKLGVGEFNEIFSSFADFLVEDLFTDSTLLGSLLDVELKISKWSDFFTNTNSLVSRESILGLIGELHFIDEWLDGSSLDYRCWSGPSGDSKDFRGPNLDVEVKVSGSKAGPLVHKISSINQLQPHEERPLYLFSLRVSLGLNYSQTFEGLVEKIRRSELFSRDLSSAAYFSEALAKFNIPNGIPSHFSTFEILESKVFQVDENFPRIRKETLSNIPEITSLQYNLDLTSVGSIEDFSKKNGL
jgi:hypothetical protein